MNATNAKPAKTALFLAFAAVYVVWGSTYLAIRYALETMPPFLMAGVRFLIAGSILFVIARATGAAMPKKEHFLPAVIIGALLFLGGNGGVVWAEQRIPSGLAALAVATEPLWVVMLLSIGKRSLPAGRVAAGLGLGTFGLFLLAGPSSLVGAGQADLLGLLAVVGGSFAWAFGSVLSQNAKLPESPFMSTAIQALAGGVLLTLFGLVQGEAGRFSVAAFSTRSILAFFYLVVFGSLIALTSYVWLLRVADPAKVSTYAYVNPVIAVLLGWALGGEALTMRIALASIVIVGAVVLITSKPAGPKREDARKPEPAPESAPVPATSSDAVCASC